MKNFIVFLHLILLLVSSELLAADSVISPKNVAVVVNTANANSLEIGQYYLKLRDIPKSNLIKVKIPDSPRKLTVEQFDQLKRQIVEKLNPDIEVILLVWTAPYAVECNSITSALTLGYDANQCLNTCGAGKPSTYYASAISRPSELGLRLSMLMPTESIKDAKALINRGVLSGFQRSQASAYFLITSDRQRSTRAEFFPKTTYLPDMRLQINTLLADSVQEKKDIMFYETGLINVPNLETLAFLPGALADHLTSTGGDLLDGAQMSSLKWLEAGATASYGSVSEPCNYWQKFPNPSVLLKHYLSGETAVEAYWKSVAWPSQGVFIGEPLAAPYCRYCALK
jgi:uncharacterized protein (TIGR03790 family)